MDNKGFTLVELIAVIALLAIIAVISFVSINEVINQSKVSDCENLIMSIKSSAKEYVSDNRYSDDLMTSMTASTLVDGNYLNGAITNPFTKEELSADSIFVEIELNSDYSAKKIIVKNQDKIEINCDNKVW